MFGKLGFQAKTTNWKTAWVGPPVRPFGLWSFGLHLESALDTAGHCGFLWPASKQRERLRGLVVKTLAHTTAVMRGSCVRCQLGIRINLCDGAQFVWDIVLIVRLSDKRLSVLARPGETVGPGVCLWQRLPTFYYRSRERRLWRPLQVWHQCYFIPYYTMFQSKHIRNLDLKNSSNCTYVFEWLRTPWVASASSAMRAHSNRWDWDNIRKYITKNKRVAGQHSNHVCLFHFYLLLSLVYHDNE